MKTIINAVTYLTHSALRLHQIKHPLFAFVLATDKPGTIQLVVGIVKQICVTELDFHEKETSFYSIWVQEELQINVFGPRLAVTEVTFNVQAWLEICLHQLVFDGCLWVVCGFVVLGKQK